MNLGLGLNDSPDVALPDILSRLADRLALAALEADLAAEKIALSKLVTKFDDSTLTGNLNIGSFAGKSVVDPIRIKPIYWPYLVGVITSCGGAVRQREKLRAEIAKAAMWMMDHIMNNRMNAALQKSPARIPLKASPHIKHADALEMDWAELLPPETCSYVFGNPPFVGHQ